MADEETARLEDDDIDNDQIDQEMQGFNEIFSKFKDDLEHDYINASRLTEVLQAFGRNPSKSDADERINELETAGKSELTLEDILQLLEERWTTVNNDRDSLRRALEKFDHTQEGSIDIEQFRSVMSTLGEPLSDEELSELIHLGSNDDQTKIDIDYLLDQLLGNNA